MRLKKMIDINNY